MHFNAHIFHGSRNASIALSARSDEFNNATKRATKMPKNWFIATKSNLFAFIKQGTAEEQHT